MLRLRLRLRLMLQLRLRLRHYQVHGILPLLQPLLHPLAPFMAFRGIMLQHLVHMLLHRILTPCMHNNNNIILLLLPGLHIFQWFTIHAQDNIIGFRFISQ